MLTADLIDSFFLTFSQCSDHLTPQHAQFARACISAKCYKAALPILDQFVYLIDPKISGIKSEDTRLYYYYGGICYIALKKWDRAIEFLETVCGVN